MDGAAVTDGVQELIAEGRGAGVLHVAQQQVQHVAGCHSGRAPFESGQDDQLHALGVSRPIGLPKRSCLQSVTLLHI